VRVVIDIDIALRWYLLAMWEGFITNINLHPYYSFLCLRGGNMNEGGYVPAVSFGVSINRLSLSFKENLVKDLDLARQT